MNEETVKLLIEAMNRLAVAIEKLTACGFEGVQVYHHGIPSPPPQHFYGGYGGGFAGRPWDRGSK